ncbi:hypothetical protein BJY00DRAFT_314476 [Aspergillus carlsbadensis]|nr:hypothetical protein BJY00DRAFT_314476 [Aspergillus carlsbadensis]
MVAELGLAHQMVTVRNVTATTFSEVTSSGGPLLVVEVLATIGGGEVTTSSMPTRLIKPTIPPLKRITPPAIPTKDLTSPTVISTLQTTRGLGLPALIPQIPVYAREGVLIATETVT